MFSRSKVAGLVTEFVGTGVLVMAVLSMTQLTAFPFFVAIVAGATVGGWWLMFGETSGAYLNPALALGMWTVRKLKTGDFLMYLVAEFLGALVAWRLVEYFQSRALPAIAGKSYDVKILLAEALGTAVFVFAVSAAVNKGYDGLRKAFTIGGGLTLGILVASFAGNALVNPAVAVGVNSISFAYLVGPLVGAVLGANLYVLLFTDSAVQIKQAVKKTTKKA